MVEHLFAMLIMLVGVYGMLRIVQHVWKRKSKRTIRLLRRQEFTKDKFGEPIPLPIEVTRLRQDASKINTRK